MSQTIKTMKMIWAALFGSTFFYFYMAFTESTVTSYSIDQIVPDMRASDQVTFYFIALSAVIASVLVPRLLTQAVRKKLTSESKIEDRAKAMAVPFVVRVALLEAVALMGFLIALINHDPLKMLPLLCVSTVGFLLCFPSDQQIEKPLSY